MNDGCLPIYDGASCMAVLLALFMTLSLRVTRALARQHGNHVSYCCSTAVAPLTQLNSYPSFKILAAAVNSMPFVYGLLMHLSAIQIYAPYVVALGAFVSTAGFVPHV
jgi:hypothetical protein